jgi:hypothetical protein
MSIPIPRRDPTKDTVPFLCPICGKIDCVDKTSCSQCQYGDIGRGPGGPCKVQTGSGCNCTREHIHKHYMDLLDNLRMDLEQLRDEVLAPDVREEMARMMLDYYS